MCNKMCINRRNFIRTAALLGGACALAPQCVFAQPQFLTEPYTDKKQLPTKFAIDACTLCQLDCPACPAKDFLNKYNHYGYLKFKDFKKFVDKNTVTEIELSNNGEIFLNPDLLDIMRYAHKKNIILNASDGVNGNTISDEVLEGLVKYKVNQVCFSISGASQEVYSIYHRGGDFNKVIDNIKKITEYKIRYNSEFPSLAWKYVVFGHNVCDMLKAKQLAKDLGLTFLYSPNFVKDYSPIKNKDAAFVAKEIHSGYIIDILGDDDFTADAMCAPMFDAPQISFDGQLLGCCCNFGFYGGNVFKQSLKDALNSPDFLYAKKMITGQVPDDFNINCSSCFRYQKMKKTKKWLGSDVYKSS